MWGIRMSLVSKASSSDSETLLSDSEAVFSVMRYIPEVWADRYDREREDMDTEQGKQEDDDTAGMLVKGQSRIHRKRHCRVMHFDENDSAAAGQAIDIIERSKPLLKEAIELAKVATSLSLSFPCLRPPW